MRATQNYVADELNGITWQTTISRESKQMQTLMFCDWQLAYGLRINRPHPTVPHCDSPVNEQYPVSHCDTLVNDQSPVSHCDTLVNDQSPVSHCDTLVNDQSHVSHCDSPVNDQSHVSHYDSPFNEQSHVSHYDSPFNEQSHLSHCVTHHFMINLMFHTVHTHLKDGQLMANMTLTSKMGSLWQT